MRAFFSPFLLQWYQCLALLFNWARSYLGEPRVIPFHIGDDLSNLSPVVWKLNVPELYRHPVPLYFSWSSLYPGWCLPVWNLVHALIFTDLLMQLVVCSHHGGFYSKFCVWLPMCLASLILMFPCDLSRNEFRLWSRDTVSVSRDSSVSFNQTDQ